MSEIRDKIDKIIFDEYNHHANKTIDAILDAIIEALPQITSDIDSLDKANQHLDSRSQQYWHAYNEGFISYGNQSKAILTASKSKQAGE